MGGGYKERGGNNFKKPSSCKGVKKRSPLIIQRTSVQYPEPGSNRHRFYPTGV